ncbi:hypothetical protein RB595_007927 [Gaeumannomyces hyphopodioides]
MRFFSFLLLALGAGLSSAYGIRAAYERAMYFAVYQMEDMLSLEEIRKLEGVDKSFKIAPGCGSGDSGARDGLMRVAKRCSLPQFLDHTWRKTKTTIDGVDYWDEKPNGPGTPVIWDGSDTDMRSSSLTTDRVKSYIMGAKDRYGFLVRPVTVNYPDGKKVTVNYHGYSGNVDEANKLWPNSNHPEGMQGYLRSLEKISERAGELYEIWEKAIAKGNIIVGDNQRDHPNYDRHKAADTRVRKHLSEAKIAAEKVVSLRKVDLGRYIKNNADFRTKFRVDPVWRVVDGVPEMDRTATTTKMVSEGGFSSQQAQEVYDARWEEIRNGEGYQGHKAAIDKAEKTYAKFMQIGCT